MVLTVTVLAHFAEMEVAVHVCFLPVNISGLTVSSSSGCFTLGHLRGHQVEEPVGGHIELGVRTRKAWKGKRPFRPELDEIIEAESAATPFLDG